MPNPPLANQLHASPNLSCAMLQAAPTAITLQHDLLASTLITQAAHRMVSMFYTTGQVFGCAAGQGMSLAKVLGMARRVVEQDTVPMHNSVLW